MNDYSWRGHICLNVKLMEAARVFCLLKKIPSERIRFHMITETDLQREEHSTHRNSNSLLEHCDTKLFIYSHGTYTNTVAVRKRQGSKKIKRRVGSLILIEVSHPGHGKCNA